MLKMRPKYFVGAALGWLSLAGLAHLAELPETAQAQNTKKAAKKKDTATTPPQDGEFTKFGIYEKTAPRPGPAQPVATTWPLQLKEGDRIALIGNTLME